MHKVFPVEDYNTPKKMCKQVVGETLVELGKADNRIVVCDADLMSPSGTAAFKKEYPDRYFNFGVAEQNMVCAAAGLALEGKTVFTSTFANFAAKRACDQASISVAYNQANVKMCGIYAGLTCEKNGGTHISVEDISIMRAIPGITVLEAGDLEELRQIIIAAATNDGPMYIRIPKMYRANVFPQSYQFQIGQAVQITDGEDMAICTCGIMTGISLLAARKLKEKGIQAKVINFGTIKPIDVEAVISAAQTRKIVTVENHSIIGGLGSAVMEVLSEHRLNPAIKRLGLQDVFGVTASLEYQLEHNELSVEKIVEKSHELLTQ